MGDSRSSTPEAPPQDLWSSILDSVSSSRSTPSKQVLLLGEPQSGKSAIVSGLLQTQNVSNEDFAMGFHWADVRDEAEEDTLARLSVYTVPSSDQAYLSLIPQFLPPRNSLPHTVVMILLDWTRPWTFIDQLHTWLSWVDKWAKGDGSREVEIVREENRERLQYYLQHYSEPFTEALPSASNMNGTVLPLGTGSFTHNPSGVPIIVVCTKADLIDEGGDPVGGGTSGMGGMVKGKGGEWEERTDGVMQVLRTTCLKYGASLFYTTTHPETLRNLRQYALHLLFVPPAPTFGLQASGDAAVITRNPFPFVLKPNALDRDRIVIPAGWDSWGKITVLREGFDAKAWGEAWERDLEVGEGEQGTTNEPTAKKMFADLVPDRGIKPPSLPPFNNPMPEQAFLAKHYDENSKKPDKDPRGVFLHNANGPGTTTTGIVGPMGSSSFSLPTVERTLVEMEGGANLGQSVSGDPRKASRRDGATRANNPMAQSIPNPNASNQSRSLNTPLSATNSGQSQHEVLHNFFQSLLSSSSRDRSGAPVSATATATKSPTASGPPNGVSGAGNGDGDGETE